MPIAAGNGLRFDYESFGAQDAPAILLIQGLGMPAAMWPDVFVATLVAQGFRVVTFDNRDCGGSSRLAAAGVPNIARSMTRALLRQPVTAPYNLNDMAKDTRIVLDTAGIETRPGDALLMRTGYGRQRIEDGPKWDGKQAGWGA